MNLSTSISRSLNLNVLLKIQIISIHSKQYLKRYVRVVDNPKKLSRLQYVSSVNKTDDNIAHNNLLSVTIRKADSLNDPMFSESYHSAVITIKPTK